MTDNSDVQAIEPAYWTTSSTSSTTTFWRL